MNTLSRELEFIIDAIRKDEYIQTITSLSIAVSDMRAWGYTDTEILNRITTLWSVQLGKEEEKSDYTHNSGKSQE